MKFYLLRLFLLVSAATATSITRGPDSEGGGFSGSVDWNVGEFFDGIVGRINAATDAVGRIITSVVGAKQETAGMTRDYLSGVYHNVTDAKKGFGTGLVRHLNQKRAMLIAGEQEMVGKVAEEDKEEEEEKEADQKEPMAMEETRDGRTFTFCIWPFTRFTRAGCSEEEEEEELELDPGKSAREKKATLAFPEQDQLVVSRLVDDLTRLESELSEQLHAVDELEEDAREKGMLPAYPVEVEENDKTLRSFVGNLGSVISDLKEDLTTSARNMFAQEQSRRRREVAQEEEDPVAVQVAQAYRYVTGRAEGRSLQLGRDAFKQLFVKILEWIVGLIGELLFPPL